MDIRKPNENELETILSLSPQAIFDGTLGEVRPTDEKIERRKDSIHITTMGS